MQSRQFKFRNVFPYQDGQVFLNKRKEEKTLHSLKDGLWCLSYPNGMKYARNTAKGMLLYLTKNQMVPLVKKVEENP